MLKKRFLNNKSEGNTSTEETGIRSYLDFLVSESPSVVALLLIPPFLLKVDIGKLNYSLAFLYGLFILKYIGVKAGKTGLNPAKACTIAIIIFMFIFLVAVLMSKALN